MIEFTTTFSPCRKYRYTLWRSWDDLFDHKCGFALFIGLNPSTADERVDDPTIRRCINFSKDWGYQAFCMANLFAYRATQPKDMKAYPDPIGVDNDFWLNKLTCEAGIVIAAWGTHGNFLNRDKAVCELIKKRMHCLELTKEGFPKHPLYVKGGTIPMVFKEEQLEKSTTMNMIGVERNDN